VADAGQPKSCAERNATDAPSVDDAAVERMAGRNVSDVCLLGVAPGAFPTLERLAQRRRGERFDAAKITLDLEAMFGTDLVSDVRAYAEPAPQGVVVVYSVKLRPEIRALQIRGNRALSNRRVAELLDVSEKGRLDLARLHAGIAAVEEAYHEESHPEAKVQHEIKLDGDQADVQITVAEGPEVKVSRINFTGLKVLKEADLRPLLGFAVGEPLRRRRTEEAATKVAAACMDMGLLSCNAKAPRIDVIQGNATVEFVIEEGPQFVLKGISLAGDLPEPEAQLRKLLRAQVGRPVSRKVLLDDIERLKQKLGNADIEPEFSLDQAKKAASLTLRIKRK
jgi:outer membrane protein insertion porin family